jgi:hypothetical protein
MHNICRFVIYYRHIYFFFVLFAKVITRDLIAGQNVMNPGHHQDFQRAF